MAVHETHLCNMSLPKATSRLAKTCAVDVLSWSSCARACAHLCGCVCMFVCVRACVSCSLHCFSACLFRCGYLLVRLAVVVVRLLDRRSVPAQGVVTLLLARSLACIVDVSGTAVPTTAQTTVLCNWQTLATTNPKQGPELSTGQEKGRAT